MERDDFDSLIALMDHFARQQRALLKKAPEGENDFDRVVSIIENRLGAKRECAQCRSEINFTALSCRFPCRLGFPFLFAALCARYNFWYKRCPGEEPKLRGWRL